MKKERLWYRDEPTPVQYRALRALLKTATGGGHIGQFSHVAKPQTFRAMHRLGLITLVQSDTYVKLTEHGRQCAQTKLTSDT